MRSHNDHSMAAGTETHATGATITVTVIGDDVIAHALAAWRAAERDCQRSLHAWYDASPVQRDTRYFAYRAALDREEAAARDLDRLSELSAQARPGVSA